MKLEHASGSRSLTRGAKNFEISHADYRDRKARKVPSNSAGLSGTTGSSFVVHGSRCLSWVSVLTAWPLAVHDTGAERPGLALKA